MRVGLVATDGVYLALITVWLGLVQVQAQSRYKETSFGQEKCPVGYRTIVTESECRQAGSALGKRWQRASGWAHIQYGCFSHSNKNIWFNANENGKVHRHFSSVCVDGKTTTTTTTTQGPTTTTTTTTTSPPFWATWVKGQIGDNCMTVCWEHECLENQWPTSLEAFKNILKGIGDETCTSFDHGDWALNPGQYVDYDNACYWSTTETDLVILLTRCQQQHVGVARYCPCAAQPSTIRTTTEAITTTTVEVTTTTQGLSTSTTTPRPAQRRRRARRKGGKGSARRRRRRRRRRSGRRKGSRRRRRRRSKPNGAANTTENATKLFGSKPNGAANITEK